MRSIGAFLLIISTAVLNNVQVANCSEPCPAESPFVDEPEYCAQIESFKRRYDVFRMNIDKSGDPLAIDGMLSTGKPGKEEETLRRFIKINAGVFRVEESDCEYEIETRRVLHDPYRTQIRASRRYKGLEVRDCGVIANFDSLGTLRYFSGSFARGIQISAKPKINRSKAKGLAAAHLTTELGYGFAGDSSRLVIVKTRSERRAPLYGDFMLTWVIHIHPVVQPDPCGYDVSLSATNGEFLGRRPDCVE